MDVHIRSVREADAQGVVDLLNPLIRLATVTIMDEEITLAGQRDYIRSFPARGTFLVAEDSSTGSVVGLQSVEPVSLTEDAFHHVGEIASFVALDAHRRGIGRRLSEATFPAARALGFLKLRATIRADNAQAIAFYTGQGFEVIGIARRHACVRGVYLDEVLAERFLG